jgi:hypothetical protein
MQTKIKSRAASKKPDRKVEKEKEKEDEEDEETSDEEQDESDDEERGRGKRKRRESKSYEPDDFTMTSFNAAANAATVVEGRGKNMGEIGAVKDTMKKFKLTSDEFLSAYKFLFSNRGISNKKLMKEKLFGFSGYLPPLPKGKYNQKRQDDEDEVIEVSVLLLKNVIQSPQ